MLLRVLRALGLALTIGLLVRRLERRNTTREEGIASAPISPAPVGRISPPARFVRRYALAEIATIIGIPLGLLALVFTALAARDTASQLEFTARQLEFTQTQIQPVLRVTTHDQEIGIREEEGGEPILAPDQLAITIEGSIRSGDAYAMSAFAMRDKNDWSVAPVQWWNQVSPRRGEIARWTTNPKLLKPLLKDRSVVNGTHLGTIIQVQYTDLLGVEHSEYFGFTDVYSAAYAVYRNRSETQPIPEKCASVVASLKPEPEVPDRPITVARLQAGSFKVPYAVMANCVGEAIG
jgi:hypothetical protein